MGSKKIAAAALAMASLAGCTLRTQPVAPTRAYDFSERDAYGQSFALSPSYAGQDTSWTTTAPARAVAGSREEKAATEAAPVKAKGAKEGSDGKFGSVSQDEAPAAVTQPTPPRPAPRPAPTPAQGGESPAGSVSGASSR